MEIRDDSLKVMIDKILYPYAIEFARKGSFKDSERFLKFILSLNSSPEYQLLLGKIYAQQGRYKEAIVEWEKVLALESENHEATAAISKARKIIEISVISPTYVFGRRLLFGLIIAVLLTSAIANFGLWQSKLLLKQEVTNLKNDSDKVKLQIESSSKKSGNYIKLSNLVIKIEQQGSHVWCYGEVPSYYLKEYVGTLVKVSKNAGSVDTIAVKVTNHYIVVSGDTLGKIALNVYGTTSRWLDIFEANKSIIKNRNTLLPGAVLYIP